MKYNIIQEYNIITLDTQSKSVITGKTKVVISLKIISFNIKNNAAHRVRIDMMKHKMKCRMKKIEQEYD